jgi:hypothetical protein
VSRWEELENEFRVMGLEDTMAYRMNSFKVGACNVFLKSNLVFAGGEFLGMRLAGFRMRAK